MIEILSALRKTIAENLLLVVIDDEPSVLAAIKRAFFELPLEIQYFSNPIEGLAFCEKTGPAVVIADNMMPEMQGVELLRQLRKSQPLTRRVMLTGHTERQEAIEAFNQDALHFYVEKPWSNQALMEVVGRQCEIYQAQKLNEKLDEIKHLALKKRNREIIKFKSEIAETETRLQIALESRTGDQAVDAKKVTDLSFSVVEPNKELREEMVAALRAQGVKTLLEFEDGKSFYSALSKDDPTEVILMEIDTPGIDGLGLLQQIRVKRGLLFSPLVLMLSKSAEKTLVVRAIAGHADGFLVKPFGVYKLLDEIKRMLDSRGALPHHQGVHNIRKLNYLILSANSTRRLQVAKSLSELGIDKYIYATDGLKGRPVLLREQIDVVFYDHNLKNPTAEEFAPMAKSTLERQVPVVILGPLPHRHKEASKESGLYYLEPVYSGADFQELLIKVVTEQLDFFEQSKDRTADRKLTALFGKDFTGAGPSKGK